MFRAIVIGLAAGAALSGCVDTHPVTSGGYYCEHGEPCAQHEGDGDCQPCPKKKAQASTP
jgi:hypothetical protein